MLNVDQLEQLSEHVGSDASMARRRVGVFDPERDKTLYDLALVSADAATELEKAINAAWKAAGGAPPEEIVIQEAGQ